ncbi:MAG: DNA-primase RepB domain-containing protein [Candidatus Acidiferrales bacterium]
MSIASDFKPRFLTASEYVLDLFDPAENVAVVVRNRARGKTVQRIARAGTVAGAEFQTWLASQNAAGSDVFLGMNPIKDDVLSRIKANIKDIRSVYLDLDSNADQSLETIRLSSKVPPPNFVLDTSPGKHQVVWKIKGVSQEEAEALLRSLANEYGGDPAATDSTRVLRLPGFANRKLSEEFIVRAHHESDTVYGLGNFTIEEGSPEASRHAGGERQSRALTPGHKSQSERDWGYAMRALSRGVDPQEVIRNIADFRAEDKYDPQDYARRTVAKAQAELNARDAQSNSRPEDSAKAEHEF